MIYSLSSYITSLAMTISTYLRGKYSGERWMILVWVWFMDNIQIDLSNITFTRSFGVSPTDHLSWLQYNPMGQLQP